MAKGYALADNLFAMLLLPKQVREQNFAFRENSVRK